MPTEYDNDLLKEGLQRYRAKEFDSARSFFERALDNADDQQTKAQANYYLSKLTGDPARKRKYLEETLAIDMTYVEARRDLAILDGKLRARDIVDPNSPPTPATGTKDVKASRFTCPKCGGRMVYSPDGVSLVCESCRRKEGLQTGAESVEQDFIIAMATGLGQRKPVSMVTFQCQGCGARFILAPQEISATCAYCGSVHVVATGERRDLLEPDAIIPMAFDQKQATDYLVNWVKRFGLRPKNKVDKPHGLYLPVWVFDILGNVPWKGTQLQYPDQRSGEEALLRLVVMGTQAASMEPVSGEYPVQYSNVCVTAMHKLNDLLVKMLRGYDFSSAPAYDAHYLAGWPAEIYEISMADASLDARKIAVEQIRRNIKSSLPKVHDLSFSASNILVSGFRLVLVPVWVTKLTLHYQTGLVVINGVTGMVYTELTESGLAGWLGDLLDT
jgi:hypothetical protein